MSIPKKLFINIMGLIKEDKRNVFYLLYFSAIEALLSLSIPLASIYIINSVLSHSSVSMYALGFIVLVVFVLITVLQVIKEYITEKFQQKIFVSTAIKIAQQATSLKQMGEKMSGTLGKYMNYFFDITLIQKVFPILLLDGSSLIMKIIVSLLLFLVFDPLFFGFAFIFFSAFIILLFVLGRNGFKYAIERSDAKHNSIYYLQHITETDKERSLILGEFDGLLNDFVKARENIFKIIIRQLTLTFFMEGLIFSGFLILGGYLVINGTLPIGKFVAAEIVVVSLTYSIKGFVKKIDYIYDIVEGMYKVDKLSNKLDDKINE